MTRKRSKGKGIPCRGNSTVAAYRGLVPAELYHTVHRGRDMRGVKARQRIVLEFRLDSMNCDKLTRGFWALSGVGFRKITLHEEGTR